MLLAEAAAGTESGEETGTDNDPILLIADDGQLSTRVDWPELLKPSTFVSNSWTIHSCKQQQQQQPKSIGLKTIRKFIFL